MGYTYNYYYYHSSIPYCPYRTLIVTLIDPLKEP